MSPFLFNFAVDDILTEVFYGPENNGIETLPGDRLRDLDYVDDITLLNADTPEMRHTLDRLAIEVFRLGMSFAPSKCQVLLDWQEPAPDLTIGADRLEIGKHFVYLRSCITVGGGVMIEISFRISKARLAFANLRHLWRKRYIFLPVKKQRNCVSGYT